jgi:ATP:cob(I)alamin adenosyltransferase
VTCRENRIHPSKQERSIVGHRLSRIITRTGDAGQTGLADGSRLAKTAPRVVALGEVDELNCTLGLVLQQTLPEPLRTTLARIQHELFDLGGDLAIPGARALGEDRLADLETAAAEFNADLPPLKEFILPGGSAAAAALHLARAVARRAERALWALADQEDVNPLAPRYLNRLSDLLFIAARLTLRAEGRAEVQWRPAARRDA